MAKPNFMSRSQTGLYPWYVAVVMLLLYVCSFVDRTIINLVVAPMQQDLHISDTQVSLLQGLAFALFYVTAGLLIARWADLTSRVTIITIGIIIWSLMTAGTAFAGTFLALLLLRVGVGIGESALTPSATSILSSLFPPERLGTAMGLYSAGPYLGIGLGLLGGGLALDWLTAHPGTLQGLSQDIRPWQGVFLIVGLPGLLLALLFRLTVREPPRTQLDRQQYTSDGASFREFFAFLTRQGELYPALFVAMAMLSLIAYGVTAWLPTHAVRSFEVTYGQIGAQMGIAIATTGPLGVLLGGLAGDRLRIRSASSPMLIPTISAPVSALLIVMAMDSASFNVMMAWLTPAFLFLSMPLGIMMANVHLVTPAKFRARTTAVYILTDAVIGLGLGPTAIALCTDFVLGDPTAVGLSIVLVTGICTIISMVLLLIARSPYSRAIIALKETQ
jgi:MFS family permease